MTSIEAPERAAPEAPETRETSRWRRFGAAAAGPLLIVACVTVAMRGFVFQNLLTNQHPDVLSFWLPRWCYMGERLAQGEIPLWNPFLQTGTPYAADPQSGWLLAPVMALFTALPCGTAMRAYIVLNPLLAGLGLYWFLRKEGLARLSATVGGLAMAMAIATSSVGTSMPFAGTLAWTPWVLLGASGYLSAKKWAPRLAWLGLGAFAWTQVAGAHMSHGLFMCTLALTAYLVARAIHQVRDGERKRWPAAAFVVGFLFFLPLAGAAVFLPRIDLLERSSLHDGYTALTDTSRPGQAELNLAEAGVWSAWPLALGSTPGAYAGAVVLLCVPAALRTRKRIYLLWAFGAATVFAYLMTLDLFVGSGWFRDLVLRLPFGDAYLHNPARLRHLLLLAVPVLGALGVQGFLDRPPEKRSLYKWLGASVALFLLLPLALGAFPKRLILFAVGAAIAIPLLIALARGKKWARIAVPGVLAVELLASALFSSMYEGGAVYFGLEHKGPWITAEQTLIPGPLRYPTVDVDEYLTPGPIARELMKHPEDRYMTWAPPTAFFVKGYLFRQQEQDWPALFNGRGMLFGIEDALGYNPVQLPGYWSFIRATNRLPIFYNASLIQDPSLEDVRLLGVRYLVVPTALEPPIEATRVVVEGPFALWKITNAEPRASVVTDWVVVGSEEEALEIVTQPGFDPAKTAVLTEDPGIEPTRDALPGTVEYEQVSPEEIRLTVHATAPSLVVIRNAYDKGWTEIVAGKPTGLLKVNGSLQAAPVPPGDHRVDLAYGDPA
ncbi:MAG: hypothetical protein WD757_01290 [Actinomycetota bacterium]